jgi:hypothetical protein
MSYTFHDIKSIIEPYLNEFPAHSARQEDHTDHPRDIFIRCRFYNIRLNPHKCIIVVESDILVGFMVSKYGIMVKWKLFCLYFLPNT